MLLTQESLVTTQAATRKSPTPVVAERAAGVPTISASEGFLLLNSGMQTIFVNQMAAEILCFPQKPEAYSNLDEFLTVKIYSALHPWQGSPLPTFVSKFQSGKRIYQCRAFRINNLVDADSDAAVAVLLERASRVVTSLDHVATKFHLTTREQEVLSYLLEGLTTKEIAAGMEISPCTVKSFLRLIMVKMGVSTRSGVVGKALTSGS